MAGFASFAFNSLMTTVVLRGMARRNIRTGAPRMLVVANDYVGHWIEVSGGYEYEVLHPAINFIKGLLGPQRGTCFDVGANIGNHSVFFQSHFSQVVAVEANPDVFEILNFNTRRFANVRAVNVALGEEEGEGILTLADGANEGTGFVSVNANVADGTLVKIMPLDSLTKSVEGKIDLIKIDVEGFEQQVLRGASQTLAEHMPIVTFEYYVSQQDASNVFELLEASGYHHFYYVGTRFDNKTNSFLRKAVHFLLDTLINSSFRVMPVNGRGRDYNMVIAIPDSLQPK